MITGLRKTFRSPGLILLLGIIAALACYFVYLGQHGLISFRGQILAFKLGYNYQQIELSWRLPLQIGAGILLLMMLRPVRFVAGGLAGNRFVRPLLIFSILWAVLRLVYDQAYRIEFADSAPLIIVSSMALLLTWIIERVPYRAPNAAPRRIPPWAFPVLACAAGCALALLSAGWLYRWHLLIGDAQSQLIQARLLARGQFALSIPAALREALIFPSAVPGVPVYSQYAPGYIAPLALISLLKLPIHTLDVLAVGAIFTLAGWLAARLVEPQQRRAAWLLATFLMFCSPFVLLLGGMMMNHVWASLLLAAACFFGIRAADLILQNRRAAAHLFAFGLMLGWAAATRPLTAAGHIIVWSGAVILFAWHICSNVGRRALRLCALNLLAGLAGFAIPMLALMFYNAKTTGNPFLLAYTASNPVEHRLGFVPDDLGNLYTPGIALATAISDLFEMNFIWLGWVLGGWIAFAAALLYLKLKPVSVLLWSLIAAQITAYFFYHYHENFFGPRFWFEFTPQMTALASGALAPAFTQRGKVVRTALACILLMGMGGFWAGREYWNNRYFVHLRAHDRLREFMSEHQAQRPAVIVVSRENEYVIDTWFLAEAGAPVWFVYDTKADLIKSLPALAGYHWLYFDE